MSRMRNTSVVLRTLLFISCASVSNASAESCETVIINTDKSFVREFDNAKIASEPLHNAMGDKVNSEQPVENDSTRMALKAIVEYDGTPRVAEFVQSLRHDPEISCVVLSSLPRLVRVAKHEQMRALVWKRLKMFDLKFVPRRQIRRVEQLALSYEMPL